ncbi:MAG: EAL domain-containing protein [Thermoleophilia bacterium]|nr:EAL domain-containing protein [Thermoleophilia bacterium]
MLEVVPLTTGGGALIAARIRPATAPGSPGGLGGDIVDWLADAVVVVDRSGRLRYANPAAAELFGAADAAAMLGTPFGFPLAAGVTTEVEVVRRGRVPLVAEMRVAPATWEGAPCHVAALRDVTDRHAAQRAAERAALHDPLTGLPGRALLLDRAGRALAAARLARGAGPALLLLDLDHFTHTDDILGHRQADALLAALGRRLAERLRGSDTLARVGGDEFGVLITGVPGPDAAEQAGRRMLSALDAPFRAGRRTVHLRGSIGVALGTPGADPERLIRRAEHAVRAAKAAGGATVRVYDPGLHRASRREVRLETDLRAAVNERTFDVRYQPIVDLASHDVIDVEALVRWPRRGGDLLTPDAFVPVAERIGLIGAIDLWVLDRACSDLGDWALRTGGRICVNLSGSGVADGGLARRVARVLDERGVSPEALRLEITESALMRDPDGARAALTELAEVGVEVALDDFGTGYSSLARLRRFPIDMLKIDRGFVAAGDQDIVRTIISLAGHLGMGVVAEGVETPAQAETLRDLGCRLGQGWLFAPAVERHALEALLI